MLFRISRRRKGKTEVCGKWRRDYRIDFQQETFVRIIFAVSCPQERSYAAYGAVGGAVRNV